MKGNLYIVATPIGNLEDITLRAINVLKSVDLIIAEDTRHSLKLLNHLEITKPLISYHRHNEEDKTENILKKIEEGNFTVNVGAAPQAAGSSGANPEPKPKKVFEKAIPEDVQYVVDNWGSVRRHISNPYKTFLQDARFSVKGENTLLIVFNPGAIGYEGCSKPEVIEMLNTLISEEIKKQVKVEVTMLENNQTFSDYYQEVVSKINMDIEEEDF